MEQQLESVRKFARPNVQVAKTVYLKRAVAQASMRMARRLWNNLSREALARLREIVARNNFSVAAGDLIYLTNGWYVTHTGLVDLAWRKKCRGIHVEVVDSLCDLAAHRFVLKATVYPSKNSSGFVGYGDADPSNVSSIVRGAEMRVAETRAVNRALRKAYGIGTQDTADRHQSGSSRKELQN